MKLVVIAVVALVLGLAGGTAFTVMRAPKRAAAHAVAGAPAAARDSARVVAATTPAPSAPVESPAAGPDAVAASHTAVVDVKPLALVPPAAVADTAHAGGYQQLGRIFAKMQTADAVKIMGYLDDDEVGRVLATLNVRQSAALLAALPSERAARLSRHIIAPAPERAR